MVENAALIVTAVEVPKKKKDASRVAAVERLANKIGVVTRKKLVWPKKPSKTMKISGLDIALYQIDKAKKGEQSGPLLIISTPISDSLTLLGLGFVSNDDDKGRDEAILKSVESIAKAEPTDLAQTAGK